MSQGLSRLRGALVPFFKVGVAVLIIYVMIERNLFNPEVLFSLITLKELVFCVALVLLGIYLSALRWLLLLRGQGFDLTMRNVFSLQLIGLFFNYIVPGGVGGDLVKGYYLVKANDDRKFLAATSIVMDRLLGLWTIIILVVASGPLIGKDIIQNPKLYYTYRGVLVAGSIFTTMLLIGFSDRFYDSGWMFKKFGALPYGRVVVESYEAVHAYGTKLTIIVKAMILSLCLQVSSVLFFWVVGNAMGIRMSIGSYMFLVPLGFVASSLPITPGGIGIGQMAFFALFNAYLGTQSQLGPNSITLYQIICFVFGLGGGYIYLTRKKYEPSN
jgi:glycosyltransferase 2 family protein